MIDTRDERTSTPALIGLIAAVAVSIAPGHVSATEARTTSQERFVVVSRTATARSAPRPGSKAWPLATAAAPSFSSDRFLIFRKIREVDQFVEVETAPLTRAARFCYRWPAGYTGLAVRFFIEKSEIAQVTDAEFHARYEDGASIELHRGVVVTGLSRDDTGASSGRYMANLPGLRVPVSMRYGQLGTDFSRPAERFVPLGMTEPLQPGDRVMLNGASVDVLNRRWFNVVTGVTGGLDRYVRVTAPCARMVARTKRVRPAWPDDTSAASVGAVPPRVVTIEIDGATAGPPPGWFRPSSEREQVFRARPGALVSWPSGDAAGRVATSTLLAGLVPIAGGDADETRRCFRRPFDNPVLGAGDRDEGRVPVVCLDDADLKPVSAEAWVDDASKADGPRLTFDKPVAESGHVPPGLGAVLSAELPGLAMCMYLSDQTDSGATMTLRLHVDGVGRISAVHAGSEDEDAGSEAHACVAARLTGERVGAHRGPSRTRLVAHFAPTAAD